MEILKVGNQHGSYSWASGFKPTYHKLTLEEEARKCPQAVIFRLLNQGKEDEAEYFFQKYVADIDE